MPFKTAFLITIRKAGWFLVLWFIATQLFDQWLLQLTHEAMLGDGNVQGRVFALAGLSIVSSIFAPLVATLTVLASWHLAMNDKISTVENSRQVSGKSDFTSNVEVKMAPMSGKLSGDPSSGPLANPRPSPASRPTSVAGFIHQHWQDLAREQLRAMGSVMMWSLLLILPGILRFFEMCFLPWVVVFDSKYQAGQKDALKESRRVFYLVWPKLVLLLLVFWIVIPLFMTSLDTFRSYFESPGTAIGLSLVDALLFILFQWLLFRLWEKAHGTELQVAGH